MPDEALIDTKVAQAYQHYIELAKQLQQARQEVAPVICQELQKRLAFLALPNVFCQFAFDKRAEKQYNSHGMYDIHLLFSANKGIPPQPLHKIASGGELSRMALVMQVMTSVQQTTHAPCPTLVFDEVDVGISGGTAQVVGELLRQLGARQQLLAITHQAQVAAAAHQHILVYKEHGEQTTSKLAILTGEAQIDELARMSGGVVIAQATKDHVKSLLEDVKQHQAQLTTSIS